MIRVIRLSRLASRATGTVAIAVALAMASVANAAGKPFAAPQTTTPVGESSAGSLAQVTLSLVLVLAAVFVAAWLVRRLRAFGKLRPGAIEIVAEVALGAKERAVLVQVGKQQLLLGVTANQVNTLHVLVDNVTVSSAPPGIAFSRGVLCRSPAVTGERNHSEVPLPPASGPHSPASLDFKAILKRSLGL